MSKSTTRPDKRTDARTPHDETIALLREVEGHRSTVRRIRELLEGARDPSEVKAGDWFTAIEYVRDETDVELVLYMEAEYDETWDRATIKSLEDTGIWCLVGGWSERSGFSVTKCPRWDVEESMEFMQSDDPIPEILPLEDAKERTKAFARGH